MSDVANGRRISSIVVSWIGAFVAALSTSLVAIASPRMAHDFATSQAAVGWVLTVYLLGLSAFLVPAGRLADVLGRKRVYVTGFVVFALASAGCAAAPTLLALVATRVVQAMGASAIMATGPAIVTQAFPPEKRARALGLQLTGTYLGLTLGPTLGGVLTTAIGWHAVFAAVAIAAVLGTVAAVVLLPADPSPRTLERRKLDALGALLFGGGLVTLSVALRGGVRGFVATPWPWLGIAAAAFVAYARHARTHPAPIVSLGLARTRAFVFGIVGAAILYVIIFILAWLVPFRLQDELHLEPAHAGLLATAQPAMLALVAPLSGILADRFGPRLPCVLAMLLLAAGIGVLAWAPTQPWIVGALAIIGAGGGLFAAPNNAVIMGAAPRDQQASAAALAATARNFGMACGVAIAIALRARLAFAPALGVAAVIALVGAAFGAARPR